MLHDCPVTCYDFFLNHLSVVNFDFLLQSSSAFLHGFHCPNAVPDLIRKMALHGSSEFRVQSCLAKRGCLLYGPGPGPDARPPNGLGSIPNTGAVAQCILTHTRGREQ